MRESAMRLPDSVSRQQIACNDDEDDCDWSHLSRAVCPATAETLTLVVLAIVSHTRVPPRVCGVGRTLLDADPAVES